MQLSGFLVVPLAAAAPHIVPLGVRREHRPPTTSLKGVGPDIPADGAVFPTAMYYANVQVGTPPQDFAVGLDSGSGDLFVEGKGCNGCALGPPNHQYDPASSSTSKAGSSFHHSYKTCSMKDPSATCTLYGTMYTDQVSLAGLGPVQVKVGAIESQTDNFDTKKVVGGLIGLGGFDGEDVLATLVRAGKCDHIWGLCMHEGKHSNGTMTVGGIDETLAKETIKYVPDTGLIYPNLDVSSLSIAGQEVSVKDSAILDSGTNILLLGSSVYSNAQSAMCSDVSLTNCEGLWSNKCFDMTDEEVDRYPALTFHLDGVSLEMGSRDYLLRGSPLAESSSQYCLAVRNGGRTGFIVGATFMRNYYVVFDKKNSRIGWGKVNEDTCGSVTGGAVVEV
jgi:hypothetical protein